MLWAQIRGTWDTRCLSDIRPVRPTLNVLWIVLLVLLFVILSCISQNWLKQIIGRDSRRRDSRQGQCQFLIQNSTCIAWISLLKWSCWYRTCIDCRVDCVVVLGERYLRSISEQTLHFNVTKPINWAIFFDLVHNFCCAEGIPYNQIKSSYCQLPNVVSYHIWSKQTSQLQGEYDGDLQRYHFWFCVHKFTHLLASLSFRSLCKIQGLHCVKSPFLHDWYV